MSYNVPQGLLDMLQSGAIPASIKVVSNDPAGGAGAGGTEDGTWANPYRTIQAAVDAMTAPNPLDPTTWFEQLWIMAGTYNEEVTITRSKYMAIYTLGPVRIGIPADPGPGEPKNLIWDKEVSASPGFLLTMPMPMASSPDFTLLEVTGDIIIKGSTEDTRTLWLQSTKAEILQGENPGLETAWDGGLNLSTLRSKLTSIQFGTEVTYGWEFQESKIDEGIFVGGSELASGRISFNQTEVDVGTFTPFGHLLQTASVWAPEAEQSSIQQDSRFDGDVTLDEVLMKDSIFEGNTTVRTSQAFDCGYLGTFTSTNDADTMQRCNFESAVDVHDITGLRDCHFQTTFNSVSGSLVVRDCAFIGLADFGTLARMHDCQCSVGLNITTTNKGIIFSSYIDGPCNFGGANDMRVDIATNSIRKAAPISLVFPAGTAILQNTAL